MTTKSTGRIVTDLLGMTDVRCKNGVEVKLVPGPLPWRVLEVRKESRVEVAAYATEREAEFEARRILGIAETSPRDAVWGRS